MNKKLIKAISLSMGLVSTIGFGTMWGISANNTYQLANGTIIGIGINNYNDIWDINHQLQINVNPYDSYQAFIDANHKNSSNLSLLKAINTNYNLWISGIILTSMSMLGCFACFIWIVRSSSKKSSMKKKSKSNKTEVKEEVDQEE